MFKERPRLVYGVAARPSHEWNHVRLDFAKRLRRGIVLPLRSDMLSSPRCVVAHFCSDSTGNSVATMPRRIAHHFDEVTVCVGVADVPSSQPGVGIDSQLLAGPHTMGASEEYVDGPSRKARHFQGASDVEWATRVCDGLLVLRRPSSKV